MLNYKYLLIVTIFIIVLNSYVKNIKGEPRDIQQLNIRGLSSTKKNNFHQLILNQPSNEIPIINKTTLNETIPKLYTNPPIALTMTSSTPLNLFNFSAPGSDLFHLPKFQLPGWGWDSEMSRVGQVIIGMGFYLLALFIKGLLISWGIGEIQHQLSDKISSESKMNVLFDIVQYALSQAANKYYG